MVRASIIVLDAAEFPEVMESIARRLPIARVKDRWNDSPAPGYERAAKLAKEYKWDGPLSSGYADILINLDTPVGATELQLHIPEMLIAKQGWSKALPPEYMPVEALERTGHHAYEEQRALPKSLPDYQERAEALDAEMRAIYGAALRAHYSRTNSAPFVKKAKRSFTSSQLEGKSLKLTGFSSESDPSPFIRRIPQLSITAGASRSPRSAGRAPSGTFNVTRLSTPNYSP